MNENLKLSESMKWVLFAIAVFFLLDFLLGIQKGAKAVGEAVGSVLDETGLTQSEEQKKALELPALRPGFHKMLTAPVPLPKRLLTQKVAEMIHDSVYPSPSNPLAMTANDEKILGLFYKADTQAKVSWIADQFEQLYGKNMANYILSAMSARATGLLYNYVRKLPIK